MEYSRRSILRTGLASAIGATGMSVALNALAEPSIAVLSSADIVLDAPGFRLRQARVNGVEANYAVAGQGPAILLLHGWPFTWFTWHRLIPELARNFTVIAPDMRGIGGSSKPDAGYDVQTLADDVAALLAYEGVQKTAVLGHDLGVGVAFMLAQRHSELVSKLILTESIVLGAPHTDLFMRNPPWWVAFHNVPELPEALVAGKEGPYLDWFFTNLTHEKVGISPVARNQHITAYSQPGGMKGGFDHYRAFPMTIEQGREAAQQRLRIPVLALGGELVGDVLYRQMAAIGDNVTGGKIDRTGHVIQEENPDEMLRRLRVFL